jgi:hypothetical protein
MNGVSTFTAHVQILAYSLWQQRGMPLGSPDEDWFQAEQIVRLRYARFEPVIRHMRLFTVSLEKRTR